MFRLQQMQRTKNRTREDRNKKKSHKNDILQKVNF